MFDKLPDDLLCEYFTNRAPELRGLNKDGRRMFPYLLYFRDRKKPLWYCTSRASVSMDSQHVIVKLNGKVLVDYFFAFISLDYQTQLHSIVAYFRDQRIFVSMRLSPSFEVCALNGVDLLSLFDSHHTRDDVYNSLSYLFCNESVCG